MTTHKRALFTLLLASLSPYQASTFTFAKTNSAAASSAFTHISKPDSSSNTNTLEAAAASCHQDDARGETSSSTQLCAAATSMEEDATTMTTKTVTKISNENLSLLSDRGRDALQQLMDLNDESQVHVYGGWPEVGVEDESKVKLSEQVRVIFVVCVCVKLKLKFQ